MLLGIPFLLLYRVDAALGPLLAKALIANNTVDQSEESIISANAAVGARMDMCSTLTIQNIASQYKLSVRTFCAKTLGFAVASVVGGTCALLMREELKIHLKHLVCLRFLSQSESTSDNYLQCCKVL